MLARCRANPAALVPRPSATPRATNAFSARRRFVRLHRCNTILRCRQHLQRLRGDTGGPANDPLAGNCKNVNSYLSKVTDNSLGFVSSKSPPYDYHLTASSPAAIVDAVDCDGNTSDIDGNMRPQGGRCDRGADELKR